MSTVDEIREQITRLEPSQAEELAIWLWRYVEFDAQPFPKIVWPAGIEKSPDICGGEPRIIRTRIPVWVLEQFRRQGLTEAEILKSYPTLRAEDLVHAWAYADLHAEQIDRQIRDNEEA